MTALFKELRGQPFGFVDMDTEARHSQRYDHHAPKSTFLVPAVAQGLVDDVHHRNGWSWSYGGYLEIRRYLWRGGYMAEGGKYLHLGVDFNVPVGTTIFATRRMQIVLVDNDHPEEGGWGTRIVAKIHNTDAHMIFAHLQPTVPCRAGYELMPGEAFAWVDDPSHNGGWFAHLHVQVVLHRAWACFAKNLHALDGYGDPMKMRQLATIHPHPLAYLGEWQ